MDNIETIIQRMDTLINTTSDTNTSWIMRKACRMLRDQDGKLRRLVARIRDNADPDMLGEILCECGFSEEEIENIL